MTVRTNSTCRSQMTGSLMAALASVCSAAAYADEPSPYYIGASETVTHDSNVYRTASAISDTYSTTSLLGGLDQSIGRQRIYANGNVGYNKYHNQGGLSNTSYGATAGWDWQTIAQLSGSLSGSVNRSLATQNGNQPLVDANGNLLPQLQASQLRNLVTSEQLNASARWGGAGDLSLQTAYSHSRVKYSGDQSLASESTGDSAGLNGYYRVGPTVTAGVGVRFTRSRLPYGVAIVPNPVGPADYAPYSTNGRNLDLSLSWRLSAQTGVDTRLSFTRQSDSRPNAVPFTGLTGSVSANYAPTAKLNFGANYSRDAGTNGSYFNVPAANQNDAASVRLSESTQTTDAVSLSAGYAASAKISLSSGLQYRRGQNSVNGAGSDYKDTLRSGTLGASYAVTRYAQLGCNYSHEARALSGVASYSYTANVIGCSAQITLR